MRGGGAGTTWSGRWGHPGCAKWAAREDDEARGGGGRGGVVWGAVGAAGRPRRLGMTSRGGCTDRGGEVRGGAGEEEGGRGRRRRRTRADWATSI